MTPVRVSWGPETYLWNHFPGQTRVFMPYYA